MCVRVCVMCTPKYFSNDDTNDTYNGQQWSVPYLDTGEVINLTGEPLSVQHLRWHVTKVVDY